MTHKEKDWAMCCTSDIKMYFYLLLLLNTFLWCQEQTKTKDKETNNPAQIINKQKYQWRNKNGPAKNKNQQLSIKQTDLICLR